MKIVKICTWKDSKEMTLEEYRKLCKEHGCRLPDANEAFQVPSEGYEDYFPFAVGVPNLGLVARGYDNINGYYYRRGVYANQQPSYRFGVLGIKDGKPHKRKG